MVRPVDFVLCTIRAGGDMAIQLKGRGHMGNTTLFAK